MLKTRKGEGPAGLLPFSLQADLRRLGGFLCRFGAGLLLLDGDRGRHA